METPIQHCTMAYQAEDFLQHREFQYLVGDALPRDESQFFLSDDGHGCLDVRGFDGQQDHWAPDLQWGVHARRQTGAPHNCRLQSARSRHQRKDIMDGLG